MCLVAASHDALKRLRVPKEIYRGAIRAVKED